MKCPNCKGNLLGRKKDTDFHIKFCGKVECARCGDMNDEDKRCTCREDGRPLGVIA